MSKNTVNVVFQSNISINWMFDLIKCFSTHFLSSKFQCQNIHCILWHSMSESVSVSTLYFLTWKNRDRCQFLHCIFWHEKIGIGVSFYTVFFDMKKSGSVSVSTLYFFKWKNRDRCQFLHCIFWNEKIGIGVSFYTVFFDMEKLELVSENTADEIF